MTLTACRERSTRPFSLSDLGEWPVAGYAIDENEVANEVQTHANSSSVSMYADSYAHAYYSKGNAPYIWISRMGVDDRADTLLAYLTDVERIGFDKESFKVDTLQSLLQRTKDGDFSGETASAVLGRLEFWLTESYLRYVCGQRYGFVNPHRLMNHLLVDAPPPGVVRKTPVYRQIFDIPSEVATDSFVCHALEQVRRHRVGDFLREVQPTTSLYTEMQKEYLSAKGRGDTARTRLARINMERARWRYPHPTTGKYVWVNLASQMLTAVNTDRDTMFTMRVCCGNASHKTPLLTSQIQYVELNPYWVIPQTIVRKEIMPRHVGDSAYYARNRYRAIDKETKEEIDPALLSAADLRSARYTLRQEKGSGNSLGRIIFRFPNQFAVYLHDTNNRGAFQYANRAISHGCVRVERPFDLALFMLDNPEPFFVDRIRMAIDMEPITAQGRRYKNANPDAKPMPSFNPTKPVPVWLDYWTLYPEPNEQLQEHPDNYGYDKVLEKALNQM